MVLGRLRATFFATKLHAAVTIVIGLLVLGVVAFVIGVVGAPSVADVDNRFGGVNETTTTIESDLVVDNPNPTGIQLGGTTVDYAIAMNGIEMATGTRDGVGVGRGRSTINLTTYLDNERIPDWWRSHVDNGERTSVEVNADVHNSLLGASFGAPAVEEEIETDITAALNSSETRPINADAALVEDPVLYVNETSGSWGEVTESETPIEMTFTVYNPNPYPIAISELGYDASMNGVSVGEGVTEQSLVVGPGQTQTIEATTVIDTETLDEWWVTHLERNQVTEMTIDFHARLDLSELGGGAVEVPLDSTTQTIDTDMFGTKNEGGTTNEEASGSGQSTPTDGTGTSDDGGETETPTDGTEPSQDGGDTETAETETPIGDTETPTDGPLDDPLAGQRSGDDPLDARSDAPILRP